MRRPTIGFIIPNFLGEYFEIQWFTMNQKAIEKDVNLIIFSPFIFLTDLPHINEFRKIFDFITSENVDGIIISSASFHCYYDIAEIIRDFKSDRKLPIISLSEHYEGIHSILIDGKKGMQKLVRHFVEVHGYKRIAFIKGTPHNKEAFERFSAYCEVLEEHDIPIHEDYIVQGNFGFQSGKQAVVTLLDERKLDVEAILAANDDMILGAYSELQFRNIAVPSGIALGGYDNIKALKEIDLPISTVQQPLDLQVTLAVEMLLDILNGKEVAEIQYLPTRPIIRQSCGCKADLAAETVQNSPVKTQSKFNENEIQEPDGNRHYHISKFQENLEAYHNTQKGYDVGFLSEFSSYIINSFDYNSVKLQCEKLLIRLGINLCYICLYNKGVPLFIEHDTIPPLESEIFFAFQDNKRYDISDRQTPFKTKKLFPDDSILIGKRHTLIFSELFFYKEHYGFIFLEMSRISPLVINLFKLQFTNCLHNIYTHQEIENAYKKLEVAKIAAESANRIKGRFLANVSHEIRTPMNAVLGFVDILLSQEDDPVKCEYMKMIQDSGKNLLNLINDILDLSRIESDHLSLVNKPINLSGLFVSLKKMFDIQANDKNISLLLEQHDSLPDVVVGDEMRLRQILTNLIGNAIKFTHKGSVTIKPVYSENILRVDILDTGIGISPDRIKAIFTPFAQDISIEREYGGTGLGLAISRKIAELMKGTLTVKTKKGEGSIFTLSLPIKAGYLYDTKWETEQDKKFKKVNSKEIVESWIENKKTDKLMLSILRQTLIILPEKLNKLRDAVIHNQIYDIQFISHELKGITGNLGMTEVYENVKKINDIVGDEKSSLSEVYSLCNELIEFSNNIPIEYLNIKGITESHITEDPSDYIILVADDSDINRKLIAAYLGELNVEMVFAQNGLEVLDCLKQKIPHLILLDIKMPQLDGVATIKLIRSNPDFKDIYVIALTAHAVKGAAKKYMEIGFNDYISKPIMKNFFLIKVKECLLYELNRKKQKILTPREKEQLKKEAEKLKNQAKLFNTKQALHILETLKQFTRIKEIDTLCNTLHHAITTYNSKVLINISEKIMEIIHDG